MTVWITDPTAPDYETTADLMESWSDSRFEADLEMAEMEAAGREQEAMRKRGECPHSSGYTGGPGMDFYPGQADLKPGEFRCTDVCGQVVPDPFAEIR